MATAASANYGYVPMAVPGQVDIYALNANTQKIKNKLRDITNEAFKEYYKPAPQLRNYYDHSYRSAPVVYVYREPSYISWFSSTTVINNYGGAPSRRSGRDDSNDAIWGIVGVIIAVVGGYLLGVEVKKHTVASDGLEAVKELKKEIKGKYTDQETKNVLDAGKRFFKKMERDSYTWIAIKASVVAGGILLAVGGFASMGAVLAAGGIVTAVALTAAAIRWGFTLGDDAKMSLLAQKILNIN